MKRTIESDYISRIKSSLEHYIEADVFSYGDKPVSEAISEDKLELVKFMDTYLAIKTKEITNFAKNQMEEIWKNQERIVLFIKDADSFEKVTDKLYSELDTFIQEYEETVDLFTDCKVSLAFIQDIEKVYRMDIGKVYEKLKEYQPLNEFDDNVINPGILIGSTAITLYDIESMINDRE